MNEFLNEFEKRFREGFNNDIKIILEKVQGEKVYACAFGTDSDFTTLFLAVNTEESFNRQITNRKNCGRSVSKETEIYYRWCCSEYQYGDDAHLNYISRLLNSTESVFDYKDAIVAVIAKIVMETDDELLKQYGQSKEDITFFVTMTDDDIGKELENQSVIQMTNSNLSDVFLKRYNK